jgi:hypothetical protein
VLPQTALSLQIMLQLDGIKHVGCCSCIKLQHAPLGALCSADDSYVYYLAVYSQWLLLVVASLTQRAHPSQQLRCACFILSF